MLKFRGKGCCWFVNERDELIEALKEGVVASALKREDVDG